MARSEKEQKLEEEKEEMSGRAVDGPGKQTGHRDGHSVEGAIEHEDKVKPRGSENTDQKHSRRMWEEWRCTGIGARNRRLTSVACSFENRR